MVRSIPRLASLLLVVAVGCAGDPPPLGEVDAGSEIDAEPIDTAPTVTYPVTGTAKDYFTGAILANATFTSAGLQAPVMAQADMAGTFTFPSVPPGSVFYLSGGRNGYRPTRGLPIAVEAAPVTADQTLVSLADARRQYSTVGLAPTAGTAVVFAELQRHNGMPLEGVPVTDIALVIGETPVGVGPYVFGAGGDLVSTAVLDTTTAFNGRARVGILDVPPGSYTLRVTYTTPAGQPMTDTTTVEVVAEGASLARSGATGMDPGMGARTFTADVYPRLQTAANGGLACANCHTTGGAAGVLPFDLPVQMTYDLIRARPGVVDTLAPMMSLLLTKPLYEDPPNHPNATFLDTSDPDYLVLLQWITQGAAL
ncbi:MAG: hypothetical protein R3B06_17730 [Kofleriaceae bacterium]